MKKALVVDDNNVNRCLLNALLKRYGYCVIEATNGVEAIEKHLEHQPSIIFMDLMMPVMDGIEACKQIKKQCGQHSFVPIIFVTAVSDEDKLSQCIESGGDDFLSKPVDLKILSARIKSMERLGLLYDAYFAMTERIQRDQELAKTVFNSVVVSEVSKNEAIQSLLLPAEVFSGDMFLTALSPSGELHIMLADFTGHGLGAALGAIPASDAFKAMTAKGFSGDKVLNAINNKLKKILPVGMFMAVQYVIVRKELDYAAVCICGMPDVYIRNHQTRQIKYNAKSRSFPLGVIANVDFKLLFENVAISIGDSIILCSDGVTEAVNESDELFGEYRLKKLLNRPDCDCVIGCIDEALKQFCGDGKQTDDISVAEISCTDSLFSNLQNSMEAFDYTHNDHFMTSTTSSVTENKLTLPAQIANLPWHWHYQLTLKGSQLAKLNPIPILIGQLQELDNQLEHSVQTLYTILTELYINALDHGILELDSTLKNSPQGFERYFDEREKRLAELNDDDKGQIDFLFEGHRHEKDLTLHIGITDSGQGFDIQKVLEKAKHPQDNALCGRGIFLVNELCHSLIYNELGNKVDVIYTSHGSK